MPDPMDANLKSMLAATPECLDTTGLASLLERDTGHASAEWRHVDQCAYCQAEAALLRSFLDPQIAPNEKPHVDAIVQRLRKNSPVPRVPWFKRLWTPYMLGPVAAVALAVVVLVNLQHRRPGEIVLDRADEITRSGKLQIVSPEGDLNSVPQSLNWKALPGASSYNVKVLEVDRTPLWSISVKGNNAALTEEIRSRIVPGKTLFWQVDAVDASGTIVASSGLTRFRLQPAH
jgi:hypothetical protein